MAIENLSTSDESRLSGAYIRTLVKQLTSSPKSTNSITNENLLTNDNQSIICDTKGADFVMAKPKNQNNATTQGHKKQVRRRLHTSRPYQERLLNMAEARKEIVTALKFHRASMKQANEKKQQQQQKQHLEHQMRGQQQSTCEIRIPKIEPSSHFTSNTNVMVENLPYYPSSSYDNHNYCYYPSSNYWSIISSSSQINESDLNIPLPNQTLGLNLNLQAFANLDTTFYHSSSINTTPPANFKYSTSSSPMSPSSSSSSTPRDLYGASTSTEAVAGVGPTYMMSSAMDMMSSMHSALDEEEMAKMRSIGEQHQVEWDDTVDLVKSAWWLKVLKSVEFSNKEIKREEGYDGNFSSHEYNSDECSFEELGEFPAWLNGNNDDQNLLQQHMDESSSEGTALPWVDIGDIDGMDEEWLS